MRCPKPIGQSGRSPQLSMMQPPRLVPPGVEIVLTSTMDYDKGLAIAWAQVKQMALIQESLDAKAFAKIAKATRLPFVTYDKMASVRIMSDLSKVLEPATPTPAGTMGSFEEPF